MYLTEAPDGSYRLTPYNPEFERQMSLAERIMHDDVRSSTLLQSDGLALGECPGDRCNP